MISHQEASIIIASSLTKTKNSITLPLCESINHIVAQDVIAPISLPACNNSAMDGYAVRSSDIPATLPITNMIKAGDRCHTALEPRTTVKIMTGAPVPNNADAVVMREDVTEQNNLATFAHSAQSGQYIRYKGQDMQQDSILFDQGTHVTPQVIAIGAATNLHTLSVAQPPTVALLATGDELFPHGATPIEGMHCNITSLALHEQIKQAGGIPLDLGIAKDNPKHLKQMIEQGLVYDMLITCGGISMGDFDYVKQCFDNLGITRHVSSVAIKPGKPFVFGLTPNKTPVFGLPGNPVSAMITFELFVFSAIKQILGSTLLQRPRAWATLAHDYNKPKGKAHIVRLSLHQKEQQTMAVPKPDQSSAKLTSMLDVDALYIAPATLSFIPRDTLIPITLL